MQESAGCPSYEIRLEGVSGSFPAQHPFIEGGRDSGDLLVLVGRHAAALAADALKGRLAVIVELENECLGVHTGESGGGEGSNVLGFSRWRLGDREPSNLIELVVQPNSLPEAVVAGRALFEASGFEVSQCADRAGRIVDRLIRPQFNLVLQAVDDGLATPDDLDLCLRLGLGYRQGLLASLAASGLADHHDVTQALFAVYGQPHFAPARRARVARQRRDHEEALGRAADVPKREGR